MKPSPATNQKKAGHLQKGEHIEVEPGRYGIILKTERSPYHRWIVLITFTNGSPVSVNYNQKFNIRDAKNANA